MLEKIKLLIQDNAIFYSFLLIFVALSAFQLGRLSTFEEMGTERAVLSAVTPMADFFISEDAGGMGQGAVVTGAIAPVTTAPTESAAATGQFVASRSGQRYHKVSCGSANSIKVENRVYFATEVAAQAAGYTRAANCTW